MNLQTPPNDLKMEQLVIGSILLDENVLDTIDKYLQTENIFYNDTLKKIYRVIVKLKENDIAIDLNTVYAETKSFIAPGYLADLINSIASTVNIEEYAKIILEKYRKRILMNISKTLNIDSANGKTTEEILAKTENDLLIVRSLKPPENNNIQDIVDNTVLHIKTVDNIIEFTQQKLNNIAGGITRQEISAIGGRPSHGKTTITLNMALGWAAKGYKVLLINREMPNIEVMKKIIAIESTINYFKFRKKELFTEEDYKEIEETQKLIKDKYKTLIMYDNLRTLNQSVNEVKRIKPDIVIEDHVGLINVGKSFTKKRFEIGHIFETYKWLSKELNLHTLLVSQLNRDIEKRIEPRPFMSDFAEAGTIEQLAETALFTFKGNVFNKEKYRPNQFEIIAGKARYGMPDRYAFGFAGSQQKLYSTEVEAQMADNKRIIGENKDANF